MRRLLIGWTTLGSSWREAIWKQAADCLPASEMTAALRYRRWQDRQRRILGRLLLRVILRQAGQDQDLSCLAYSAAGRPFLPGRGDFSITHAGEVVACAWTPHGRVGLDVDTVRPGLELSDFQVGLTPDDYASLYQSSNPLATALKLWTMTEAVAKAAGLGIAQGRLPALADGPVVTFGGSPWRVRQAWVGGYAVSCALDGPGPWRATIFRAEFGGSANTAANLTRIDQLQAWRGGLTPFK